MTPLIGSAGLLGHQETTLLFHSSWFRIFQMAFTFREVVVTGRSPSPVGVGSTKPLIPCLSALNPVAILVHNIGERGGSKV